MVPLAAIFQHNWGWGVVRKEGEDASIGLGRKKMKTSAWKSGARG